MRIALFGVGHWHFPLYEAALLASGATIVGISEPEDAPRAVVAQRFGAKPFRTHHELMDGTDHDFAFVFGRHRDMADVARELIRRKTPFSIEKPAGFTHDLREDLRRAADGQFVSFPLVYRVTPLFALFDELVERHGGFASLSVRCLAGPPQRYLANGSPWMVDPKQSGGGCTRNLAPHYVDMFLAHAGGRPVSVAASMNVLAYGSAVEDYSSLMIRSENGAIATIETGYNFPVHHGPVRDFSLIASTASTFIRASESQVEIFGREGRMIEKRYWNIDSNAAFAPYVHDVLRRFRDGLRPIVEFEQFNDVMKVIDAGYVSVEQKRTIQIT